MDATAATVQALYNLGERDFSGWNLRGAHFEAMKLPDIRLNNADLTWAVFARTDLRGANFRGAIVAHTAFTYSDLHDVDFDGALVYDASFVGARYDHLRVWAARPCVAGTVSNSRVLRAGDTLNLRSANGDVVQKLEIL